MGKKLVLAGVLLGLGGCAAVFDGTSQQISVNTNPPGAQCEFTRHGETIATILATPASATVQKTKYDITITCKKDGYTPATYLNHSGVAAATVGDAVGGVLTGGIAWAVDSGTGADNKYDSVANLTLAQIVQPSTPVSSLPPQSATEATKKP